MGTENKVIDQTGLSIKIKVLWTITWFITILVEQYHLFVVFSVQEEEMKRGKDEEGTDSGAL